MKNLRIKLLALFVSVASMSYGQHSDANVFGDVQSEGEHIPFATIYVKGTTFGTATDETGHYMLIDLPPGKHILIATSMGYHAEEKEVLPGLPL